MKGGNDKETSELLYSTLFCHFKEPLFSFAKILFSKRMTFPDFTRHLFVTLTESIDTLFQVY
ncbi:hypothetical protein HMPREF2992_10745 [Prevotella sp. HMSC069G02]|uniref:Uncharacterized protein n=1 Tax=Segatella oris TaxID=28135 RepID=A0A3S4X6R3_9BACT|nr:hypothetical protein HMPREF2992_10745 [Prevotella sp. HMSC069G02]VEH15143.1 Uncharacterised protein [Segatella oris]